MHVLQLNQLTSVKKMLPGVFGQNWYGVKLKSEKLAIQFITFKNNLQVFYTALNLHSNYMNVFPTIINHKWKYFEIFSFIKFAVTIFLMLKRNIK